jgi:hypothetical protein
MYKTHAMSCVMLKFGWTPGYGEDEIWPFEPVEDPEDVEKVLLRSMPRRTTANKSSRNFFDDASDKPVLSCSTSYSPTNA